MCLIGYTAIRGHCGPEAVLEFVDTKGVNPFRSWLNGLRDVKAKAVIADRIARVRAGNTGDTNDVGGELRINFGPGYRVYFGNDGKTVVILLCGGDKSTQDKDIRTAKANWLGYKARTKR